MYNYRLLYFKRLRSRFFSPSPFSALLIIALIPSYLKLLCAIDPITHIVKLSLKAIAPLLLLIRRCTRLALKKRNKIRNREEP